MQKRNTRPKYQDPWKTKCKILQKQTKILQDTFTIKPSKHKSKDLPVPNGNFNLRVKVLFHQDLSSPEITKITSTKTQSKDQIIAGSTS